MFSYMSLTFFSVFLQCGVGMVLFATAHILCPNASGASCGVHTWVEKKTTESTCPIAVRLFIGTTKAHIRVKQTTKDDRLKYKHLGIYITKLFYTPAVFIQKNMQGFTPILPMTSCGKNQVNKCKQGFVILS